MERYGHKMQKVSLLVTTYNAVSLLPLTLQCIEQQDYPAIEVIIVDGASKDGTVDLIREFAKTYPDEAKGREVKWVSEKDNGLYDAMNKAWRMSTGDIIAVCNDRLCESNAITLLVNAIEAAGEDCVGAHADLIYEQDGKTIRSWHMGEGKLSQGWMPGHPTMFIKREIYEKYGEYDISYKCAADFEFMVRFLKDGKNKLAYVPKVLVSMFYGGTSNAGISNYWVSVMESHKALRKNHVPFAWWLIFRRTIRVMKQF